MQLKKYLLKKISAFAVVLFALGLTSCGSYQYVGQNSDGIYGEDGEREVDVVQVDTQDNGDNTYYKNYFKEKSLEMGSDDNDAVFVDIDSYEGTYSDEMEEVEDANVGYVAWGENNSDVSINIYNNGYNNYWNRPFFGWNSFGWNRPYSGWNIGYGYGGLGHYYSGYQYGGIYDPFWCPPFGYGYNYGYGYGYGYGGNSYYGGYYGRNGVAYNATRRGDVYGRNSVLGRRVAVSRRSNSISTRTRTSSVPRTRTVTPRTRGNATTPRPSTPRTRTSIPRTRSNSSTPRSSTPRSSTPRVRTTTPRSSTPRSSSTRSSSSSSRSSSGSRRKR